MVPSVPLHTNLELKVWDKTQDLYQPVPSGNRLHSELENQHFCMGKSTLINYQWAMFNSYVELPACSQPQNDARTQALVTECANVSIRLPPEPNPTPDDVSPDSSKGASRMVEDGMCKKKSPKLECD